MSKKRKPARSKASGPTPAADPAPPSNPPWAMRGSSKPSLSQYVSFGLLLGVIAVLGFVFFEVMAKFIVPLFLAAILVVVFRPLHRWILEKCGGREQLSALLTTVSVLVVVLAPIGIVLVMAAAEGREVIHHFNAAKFVDGFHQVRTNLKLDMPCANELRSIESDFDELEENASLSTTTEDEHRELLFSIEESAELISHDQKLNWPPQAPSDDESTVPQSAWEQFTTDLYQARKLHGEMEWDGLERDSDNRANEKSTDVLRVSFHEYEILLHQTAEHFMVFKNHLLGGKTSAWLKDLANPSASETESYIGTVVDYSRDKLLALGSAGASYVVSILVGSAIMIIGFYFFLLDGPNMIENFKGLSPIDDEHEQELVDEFARVSRAVVVATLLSALAQGLLAGIGFYFTGLDSIFLLTVLSAVMAMVPFVGAASVWVPCCLYLYFFQGNIASAMGLAIYGAAIISMADNVIKPYILHGQSNLHPLLALLSVLGGVTTLGPIGILVGPMVVAFLQTLLKILQREMSDLDGMSHREQPTATS